MHFLKLKYEFFLYRTVSLIYLWLLLGTTSACRTALSPFLPWCQHYWQNGSKQNKTCCFLPSYCLQITCLLPYKARNCYGIKLKRRRRRKGQLPSVVLEWNPRDRHSRAWTVPERRNRIFNGLAVHMYVCTTVSFSMWAQLCGHNMNNESFGRWADDNALTSWQKAHKQIWQEFNYKRHHLSLRCKVMSVFLSRYRVKALF